MLKRFGTNSPAKVVENTIKHFDELAELGPAPKEASADKKDERREKVIAKLSANMKNLHFMLYGDPDTDPKPATIKDLIPLVVPPLTGNAPKKNVTDSVGHNLFFRIAQHMCDLEFEAVKQAAAILNFIIRRASKEGNDVTDYIQKEPKIVEFLLAGYADHRLAQNVGSVLQEMAKRPELANFMFSTRVKLDERGTAHIQVHPNLAEVATSANADETVPKSSPTKLTTASPPPQDEQKHQRSESNTLTVEADDVISQLFVYAQNQNLIIASDAFETLSILLNRHVKAGQKYMIENYAKFFQHFNALVMSDNYMTQGNFLKLLADILLAKHNAEIRRKYVSDKNHLRIIMTLLKNQTRLISQEAFHIFKVFVANPAKSPEVAIILWKNKQKLIQFLNEFQQAKDKTDPDFAEEKKIVISHLQKMDMPPAVAAKLKEKEEAEKAAAAAKAATEEKESETGNDNAPNDAPNDSAAEPPKPAET